MLASSGSAGPDEIGVPQQMRGEPRNGVPPTACADGWGQHRAAVDSGPAGRQGRDRRAGPVRAAGKTTFRSPAGPERIGNPAKMPATKAVAGLE